MVGCLLFLGEHAAVQKAFSAEKAAIKVFVVEKEYNADVKVFVVAEEYQCDLRVFKVYSEHAVVDKRDEEDGMWFFVDYEYLSDKTIFFAHRDYYADLKIFYVNSKEEAGWRVSSKKRLMKLGK